MLPSMFCKEGKFYELSPKCLLMRTRVPRYTNSTLSEWYHIDDPGQADQILRHFSGRISMTLEILDKAEIITKTA
jgi:DNA polymerase zeta